ncbi:MAG: acyltransferase, partial [Clostridia bacterium]|nr:acyltransferase [Clostridia bacterium]
MEKTVETKKVRQSNIELLRIIAMLLIVAHHFSLYGSFPTDSMSGINQIYIDFLAIGGKIGNNIFILISGYFLVTEKSHKWNKIIMLWLHMFTYSFGIFLLVNVFDLSYVNSHLSLSFSTSGLNKTELIECLFPVASGQWWFASTYFVLMLLSPFVNKVLTNMKRQEYKNMLLIVLIIWCIVPSFTARAVTYGGSHLSWFISAYAIGG